MQKFTLKSFFLLGLMLFLNSSWVYAQEHLTLGVFQSFNEDDDVEKRFSGLATYLSNKLPNYTVVLKPLKSEDLVESVRNRQVDLLLTDPYHYQVLRTEIAVSGIAATLQNSFNGKRLDALGGVIYTHANSPIKKVEDLVSQRIAIPSKSSTGGYLLPIYEIKKHDINLNKLHFQVTGSNEKALERVLNGYADVGFIRTGMLEQFIQQGKLDIKQIKIIHTKHLKSFPQIVSTDLYPEWPFVFLPGLNEDIQKDISAALFSLRDQHPAALQAGIAGFITPKDYLPFENVLKQLKVAPFNVPVKLTTSEFWQLYKWQILALSTLVIIIMLFLLVSERLRKQIKAKDLRLTKQAKVDKALLELPKLAENENEDVVMRQALEKIEQLTESDIGGIVLSSSQEKTILLSDWSKKTKEKHFSLIEEFQDLKGAHIEKAGIWSLAAKLHIPLMINDFASYPRKKGLPANNDAFNRVLSVPVIDKGKVVMVVTLGNKPEPYNDNDIEICQLITNELWVLIKEQRNDLKIEQERNKYEHLLNDLGENYFVFSLSGFDNTVSYLSAGFEKVFELKAEEIINKSWFNALPWYEESIQSGKQAIEHLIDKDLDEYQVSMTLTTASGKHKVINILLHGEMHGNTLSIDGLAQDITANLESESHLKQAAQVFEYANEGILITNKDNIIIRANNRLEEISGYKESELIGKNPKILSSGQQDQKFYDALWSSLSERGYWEGDLLNRRKSGEFFPCRSKISTVTNDDAEIEYYIGLFSDITEEREYQNQLERMAHYDALTGLPNRLLLSDHIHQALSLAQRNDEIVSLMFIDLDGFKEINDTYGHSAGDHLLQVVAQRLQEIIRKQDTVSRLGGDEFVILISGNTTKQVLHRIEQDILIEIAKPVPFEKNLLAVSSSIGVVYHIPDTNISYDPDQLLRMADQSMYQAKLQGKNQIQYFEVENSEEKYELKTAFKEKQFELYYQPKIDFLSGRIFSLEALIRWNHPTKGFITPDQFLPLLKHYDLMEDLSIYVIEESANFLKTLRIQGFKTTLSININGFDLTNPDFKDALMEHFFSDNLLTPKCITLEILESSALENVKQISTEIEALKSYGFKIAIDDFGTGHASLNYLKNLPVDQIKIDQEFIREIFNETSNLSIIEAIKSMAEAFDLMVIAEGVETDHHIELLLKLGVTQLQGYAISRPLSDKDITEWMDNWQFDEKWFAFKEVRKREKELLKARISYRAWMKLFVSRMESEEPLSHIELSNFNTDFNRWINSHMARKVVDDNDIDKIIEFAYEILKLCHKALDLRFGGQLEEAQELVTQIKEDQNVLQLLQEK